MTGPISLRQAIQGLPKPRPRMTSQEYQAAKAEGYSDEEIQQEGYDLPESPGLGRHAANAGIGAAQGLTLGSADEIGGGVGALLGRGGSLKERYIASRDAIRNREQAARAEDPLLTGGSEFAAGMLLPGLGVAKSAKGGAGVLRSAWNGLKAGAATGGAAGLLHGAGRAGDEMRGETVGQDGLLTGGSLGNMVEQALSEGALGGLAGGALGGVVGGGTAAARKIRDEARLFKNHGDAADIPIAGKLVKARRNAVERQAEARASDVQNIDPNVGEAGYNPTPSPRPQARHIPERIPAIEHDPMMELRRTGGESPIPFPSSGPPPANRGGGFERQAPMGALGAANQKAAQRAAKEAEELARLEGRAMDMNKARDQALDVKHGRGLELNKDLRSRAKEGAPMAWPEGTKAPTNRSRDFLPEPTPTVESSAGTFGKDAEGLPESWSPKSDMGKAYAQDHPRRALNALLDLPTEHQAALGGTEGFLVKYNQASPEIQKHIRHRLKELNGNVIKASRSGPAGSPKWPGGEPVDLFAETEQAIAELTRNNYEITNANIRMYLKGRTP